MSVNCNYWYNTLGADKHIRYGYVANFAGCFIIAWQRLERRPGWNTAEGLAGVLLPCRLHAKLIVSVGIIARANTDTRDALAILGGDV